MNCTNKITTIARVKFKHQKLFYIVFKTLKLPIQVLLQSITRVSFKPQNLSFTTDCSFQMWIKAVQCLT